MEYLISKLREAVESNPEGISGARALEELHRTSLVDLESQEEDVLRRGASATGDLAQAWRAKATQTGDPNLARYVGHLECLASIFRTAAQRTIPKNVRNLLGRKHAPRLILELAGGDRRVSDLGLALGIDVSYAEREIMHLAQADVVRTAKRGRERWVALTSQGRRLVDMQSEVTASPRVGLSDDEAEATLATPTVERQALVAVLRELSQRQSALEKRIIGHAITSDGLMKEPARDPVKVKRVGFGKWQHVVVSVPKSKEEKFKKVMKDMGASIKTR
jgi:predicted transcriptional regulator